MQWLSNLAAHWDHLMHYSATPSIRTDFHSTAFTSLIIVTVLFTCHLIILTMITPEVHWQHLQYPMIFLKLVLFFLGDRYTYTDICIYLQSPYSSFLGNYHIFPYEFYPSSFKFFPLFRWTPSEKRNNNQQQIMRQDSNIKKADWNILMSLQRLIIICFFPSDWNDWLQLVW